MNLSKILFGAVIPFFAVTSDLAAADPDDEIDQSTRKRVKQTLLSLPLRFEENTGQYHPQVEYLARGPGYTLFLTPGETVLSLAKGAGPKRNVVRVRLDSAKADPLLRGEGQSGTPTNYLIGDDPEKWRTAPNYERVRCESVYPGIDLVYHGKQHQLEYDFELAPGSDPDHIALRYDGIRSLRVDHDGSLVIRLKDGGELRQDRPVSYQMIDGVRRDVASHYRVTGKRRVTFKVGSYDASQALVIDPPILSYSTYLGGSSTDRGFAIAADAAGIAYIAGVALSTNFPTLNQYQSDQIATDAFVAKIDTHATGAASLLYSTYLGGDGADEADGIAVNSAGQVLVTGKTSSTNFPTLNQYQTDQVGDDAFVTKLDTNVSGAASLLYSTYLGGNGIDKGNGIAIGSLGNVFVTGQTDSTDFPTLNQYQSDQPGSDAFVTKLDTSMSGAASLLYSTYLGGSNLDLAHAVAVDPTGRVYVAGDTTSTDFPILNQYQSDQPGSDAFFTKINPLVSGVASLVYSTYLGGSVTEEGDGIAVDANGSAYVTGTTSSTDFPVLNQYQTDQPGADVFVTRINTNLAGVPGLVYSTYLGGGADDFGNAIAVDSTGNAFVTGYTESTNFPTVNAGQTNQPDTDALYAKIDTNASGVPSLIISSYLGGDMVDIAWGIGVQSGNVYIGGETSSTNFPTANEYQLDQGGNDAFVAKFGVGPSNETCASSIAVALDQVASGTTIGAVNDYQLSGAACFTGIGQTASTAAGRDAVFSFTAPATDSYSFRVSNYGGGGNPVLYVASTCPAATGTPVTVTTCLGAANRTGAAGAFTSEEVKCLPLTAGQQVFIFVDEDALVAGSEFNLEVNKCPTETEANNTPGTADVPHFGVEGSIDPNTDVDFYVLGSSAAGARVFSLIDARAANADDFELRVTTATDTLEYDHFNTAPPFGDDSATVGGTPLTGATAYLRVSQFNVPPPVASEPYRLYTVIQPAGAGLGGSSATAESEPNDTIAQADSAANNFFSGTLTGPAPSTDKDFYSFTATAGELVFLSLDADPLRNNTPINARIVLQDENGGALIAINDTSSVSSTSSGAGSLTSLTPFSVAESLVYRAQYTGTYYAGVAIGTSSATAIGAGDYLLSIAKGFQLISAASRKTHGGTPFDIPLPLIGEPGIECRSGGGSGNHTLVFTFNNNVVSGSPVFSGGVGGISGGPIFAGNTMTLNLTGVLDQQKITITLVGIKDSLSQVLPNTEVSMNVLLGDTTGNKNVNATDVSQTKLQSGNAATATNFRTDVTVSGTINATDVSQVKLNSGHGVP